MCVPFLRGWRQGMANAVKAAPESGSVCKLRAAMNTSTRGTATAAESTAASDAASFADTSAAADSGSAADSGAPVDGEDVLNTNDDQFEEDRLFDESYDNQEVYVTASGGAGGTSGDAGDGGGSGGSVCGGGGGCADACGGGGGDSDSESFSAVTAKRLLCADHHRKNVMKKFGSGT